MPEKLFTPLVRAVLRLRPQRLRSQIDAILSQRFERPSTLVAIATHFSAAHQFAALRDWLRRRWNVRLVLVVQVTDASPQRIWYVPGADLICVPSEGTKKGLLDFARQAGLRIAETRVVPYPVGPSLGKPVPGGASNRERALNPAGDAPIRVCVPVSGAAVGLAFSNDLILGLLDREPRFQFNVISQDSRFTGPFLQRMREQPRVTVHAALEDIDVVRAYEKVFTSEEIAIEVTKPSEHSFKALFQPDQVGGALLMFAEPVQRQEYDNLDFLRLHGLLASVGDRDRLWALADGSQPVSAELLAGAAQWRALELPRVPSRAVGFITWALKQSILHAMTHSHLANGTRATRLPELSSEGISDFWDEVARLV
jgi:hypothetical protein